MPNNTMITFQKNNILGTFIYLAVGLAYHLVMGDAFSWQDPWLYVHMFLWPFFLVWWLFVAVVVVVIIIAIFSLFGEYAKERAHRKLDADEATIKEEKMEEERRRAAMATPRTPK